MRPLLTLAFALLPCLVAAQTPSPDCRDDRMRDRCASAEQEKARALFGLDPIEAHAGRDDEVRRVLYVDGYGYDLIAISAIRPRGRGAELRVHFPGDDERIAGSLTGALPLELWRRIDTETGALSWAATSSPPSPAGQVVMCLHSWVYTLEAAIPGVRRMTHGGCGNGSGREFATRLADMAVALFPHCAMLDGKRHRNSATRLRACGALSGRDRIAAARVMNGADAFRGIRGGVDAPRLAPYFAADATIDWSGEHSDPAAAASFWASRMGPADKSFAHLYIDRIEGVTPDRVRLLGTIGRTADTLRGRGTGIERGAVEQIWTRQADGEFRITRATVGPWRAGG
jgi:hypothetical protein